MNPNFKIMETKEKHPLQRIIKPVLYKNVWVEAYIGGYFVLNQKVKTIEEVDEVILNSVLNPIVNLINS